MATIGRFEDIQSWQKARELVRRVYSLSARGAFGKDFGFKDQICRAAVSCMSNIAEGFARKSDKDFAHFLDMSRASAIEVQSLLYVALDIGYVAKKEFEALHKMADETVSLVGGFTSYLRSSSTKNGSPSKVYGLRTSDSGRKDGGNRQ